MWIGCFFVPYPQEEIELIKEDIGSLADESKKVLLVPEIEKKLILFPEDEST